jgi:hypothetical protein
MTMEISSADQEKYQKVRSHFMDWLTRNHMYNTLGLVAQCTFALTTDDTHVASVMMRPNQPPKITLHVKLLDNPVYCRYVFLHELRHIPQMAKTFTDEFLNSVPWPAFIDTPVKRKTAFRMFGNVAADMALNEDLRRLLGKDEFESSVYGAIQLVAGPEAKPCVVSNPEWARDQSFVYYLLKLIEEADDPEKGPQGYQAMDEHDVEGDGESGGEGLAASLRGILEAAEQTAKTWANAAGRQAADQDLQLTGNSISDTVKSFIRQMRVKVNRIYEGNASRRYAFEKFNRLWPTRGLPGHRTHIEKIPGIVIVLDTSGSVVYDKSVFEQLRGATLELQRQKKVQAVYCCDVELHKMTNTTDVRGGGGTMLEPEHIAQIRKELGLGEKEMLSICYLTDGDVNLDNLRKDPTTDLHEMILERGGR